MQNTYNMLKEIITGKEEQLSEKTLIEKYQNELCSNILAYFYVSNFGMINLISDLYPFLDNEDKASFCLQEMDKCLRNFNLSSNVKFMTYFSKCYKNRLRTEFEQIKTQKRKSNYFHTEELDLNKIEAYKMVTEINELNDNVKAILEDYNLTEKETDLCLLLNDGYKPKEISYIYNLKPVTIYQKINLVRKKILKYI